MCLSIYSFYIKKRYIYSFNYLIIHYSIMNLFIFHLNLFYFNLTLLRSDSQILKIQTEEHILVVRIRVVPLYEQGLWFQHNKTYPVRSYADYDKCSSRTACAYTLPLLYADKYLRLLFCTDQQTLKFKQMPVLSYSICMCDTITGAFGRMMVQRFGSIQNIVRGHKIPLSAAIQYLSETAFHLKAICNI